MIPKRFLKLHVLFKVYYHIKFVFMMSKKNLLYPKNTESSESLLKDDFYKLFSYF